MPTEFQRFATTLRVMADLFDMDPDLIDDEVLALMRNLFNDVETFRKSNIPFRTLDELQETLRSFDNAQDHIATLSCGDQDAAAERYEALREEHDKRAVFPWSHVRKDPNIVW